MVHIHNIYKKKVQISQNMNNLHTLYQGLHQLLWSFCNFCHVSSAHI